MRWCWVVLAACDGSGAGGPLVTGGPVVSVAEGDHLALSLAAPSELGDAPSWIHFADETHTVLALDPPCSLITGTTGPTREVIATLSAGDRVEPLLVEVRPSAAGECAPTVTACVRHGRLGPANPKGLTPCGGLEDPLRCDTCDGAGGDCDEPALNRRIDVDYLVGTARPFSNPQLLDRALVLVLHEPDVADSLDLRVTTEAPIRFTSLGRVGADHAFCAVVPNADIVGMFDLDYVVARGTAMDNVTVDSGQFQLAWNEGMSRMPYGAEVTWCATDGAMPCAVTRAFVPPTQPRWCIQRAAGARLTAGVRLWATSPGDHAGYAIDATASWPAMMPSIGITVPPVTGVGELQIPVDASAIPLDLILELGTTGAQTAQLTLQGVGSMLPAPYTVASSVSIRVDTACQ